MKNNQYDEKDPYAEYDKFWDKLDEVEELKADEDYFKEKNRFKALDQPTNEDQRRIKHNQVIQIYIAMTVLFFIGGIVLLFIYAATNSLFNVISIIQSVILFGIISFIILKVLSKLKYK